MSDARPSAAECTCLHAALTAMDAIASRAGERMRDEPTYAGRVALAAAHMQGAATLYAAEVQARALDRLAAHLAPSIESLAELIGLALDE